MGKYIKLFENHSGYTAFTQTEEFVKPNVSHCIQENEVHYNPLPIWGTVDLGLSSGTLWATMNVGAASETDNGLLFAWGETDGYTTDQVGTSSGQKYFGWANNGVNDYKYANGAYNKLTKYCPSSASTYWDGSGDPDGLITLENADDVAYAASNGQYRMPTKDEYLELASGTTNGFVSGTTFTLFAWNNENGYAAPTTSTTSFADTKLSGVTGQVYFKEGVSDYATAISSGEYVFLPACGSAYYGSVTDVGQWGNYWSSSLRETDPTDGWDLYFGADGAGVDDGYYRCYGGSVRGVLAQS